MKKFLEIVRFGTNEVVKKIDVTGKSERQLDKIEMGLYRQIDLEKYYIKEVTKEHTNEQHPNTD